MIGRSALAVALLLTACAPKRVQTLEAELARVTAERDALAAQIAATEAAVTAEQARVGEIEANAVFDEATAAAEAFDVPLALAKLEEIATRWPDSRAARSRVPRMREELSHVGQTAPPLTADPWYTTAPSPFARVSLVVFFEEWCPHCVREVPKLQALHQDFSARGVQVVGLTRITRESTDEKVRAFIGDHGLTYPIGKEDGKLSEFFGVSGIPAAALVRDGVVIWRGHPAKVDAAMLERALQ